MITLNNNDLLQAYKSGANEVIKNKVDLNAINVFPVADGDTGNNLASLMKTIIKESSLKADVHETMETVSDAALIGARGNSGIIFAGYICGLNKEIQVTNGTVAMQGFVDANKKAVQHAYDAVDEPVEGTMLTAIRVWAEALSKFLSKSNNYIELMDSAAGELDEAVDNTMNQMDLLRKANVVDAGAKGFLHFIKGFIKAIKGESSEVFSVEEEFIEIQLPDHDHGEITYRYCSEAMLVESKMTKTDLREALHSLGDSQVIAGTDNKMRIHLHTDQPTEFFKLLRKNGDVVFQKVDDMVMQNAMIENRKGQTALVTDSVADIPQAFIDEHQIHVLPLQLLYKDGYFIDRRTIDVEEVLSYDKGGKDRPTSTQPDLVSTRRMIDQLSLSYDKILIIPVSKALSGTNNVFTKAAESCNRARVKIIDSRQNSAAQGLLVMAAAQLLAEGVAFDHIIDEIEQMVARSKIYVGVKNLHAMIRSGRLSTKGGKIANAVNLKPIVTLDDQGEGGLGGFAFSFKSSLKKIEKKLLKVNKESGIESYSVVHINNLEEAKLYAQKLTQSLGQEPVYIEEVSSIIAVGAGQGAIAVGYIAKGEK